MIRKFLNWWNNRPLGYTELHVPAGATKEEVKRVILHDFEDRLPINPRDRAMRIAVLLEQHCTWQKFTQQTPARPNVPVPAPCRKCEGRLRAKHHHVRKGMIQIGSYGENK